MDCVLDPDALHFGASVTASSDYDADCGQGEFVEGLWERDVAELFIAEHEMYQEFNLSPNGAWWSAVFNAPRNRCAKRFSMPQDLKIFCETETDSWRVALSIPRNQFSLDLSFTSHTRLNCNVITGNPVRQYLSWCRLPGAEADFHQPQHFAVCSLCDQAS